MVKERKKALSMALPTAKSPVFTFFALNGYMTLFGVAGAAAGDGAPAMLKALKMVFN